MSNNGGMGEITHNGLSHALLSLAEIEHALLSLAELHALLSLVKLSHAFLMHSSHWPSYMHSSHWLMLSNNQGTTLEALTSKYKGLKPRNVLNPQCTQLTIKVQAWIAWTLVLMNIS